MEFSFKSIVSGMPGVDKLVDIGGDVVNNLTGKTASDAAKEAANRQIAGQEAGLAALRADLEPFREAGVGVLPQLTGSTFQERSAQDIINDPFFRAMAQEQDRNLLAQRAALGLAGSGGTQDSLTRNMLLLGNQFRQQDLGNQFAKFNSLFNLATMGQNAAARTGTASLQSAQNIGALQGVGPLADANRASQLTSMIGTGLGMFLGGPIGGAVGGALGGGSPVGQQVFGLGNAAGGGGTGSLSTFGL